MLMRANAQVHFTALFAIFFVLLLFICKMFICCVPNCGMKNNEITMHGFPNPIKEAERFQLWVSFVGRKDLMENSKFTVRKNYRICDLHFKDSQKFASGPNNATNLKRSAIPEIFSRSDSSEVNLVEASVTYDSDTRDSTKTDMVEESDPLDNKSPILTRTLHEPHSNSPLSLMKKEYERKLEEAYYNIALLNSQVLEQQNKILDLQLTVKNLQNEKKSTDAAKCLFMYRNGELVRMEINSSETDENK